MQEVETHLWMRTWTNITVNSDKGIEFTSPSDVIEMHQCHMVVNSTTKIS
jgi:hypothetical protein